MIRIIKGIFRTVLCALLCVSHLYSLELESSGIARVASTQDSISDGLFSTKNDIDRVSADIESRAPLGVGENKILLPGQNTADKLLPIPEMGMAPPYGANLFAGGYETARADGLNSDYIISFGDKISIWMWGAANSAEVVTVDNQGNIFLPNIGPIQVAGVKARNVNEVVTKSIKRIYKEDTKIYVNLLAPTPIAVMVAGAANRPGQYAGMASDTVLYYLKRAGGIDSERGSYRKVQVLRGDTVIHTVDLYEFLRQGVMPTINFKDGDVIFVPQLTSVINVTGGVRNPFRFEFSDPEISGLDVLSFVRPLAQSSHVFIRGVRQTGLFSIYLSVGEFEKFILRDGDKLTFNKDRRTDFYEIEVRGSYLGPSHFRVNNRLKLHDVLNHIEIDPNLADFSSVYIMRQSAAIKQKRLLDESLDRLERSVLVAPTSSTGEAQIRAQEAQFISDFIARARQVSPQGKVVVSYNDKVANVSLENGDIIVIPSKTDLIQVGGEVTMPQSIVYNTEATVADYIAWAGGFTDRANFDYVIVVRANGLSEYFAVGNSTWFSSKDVNLKRGDSIIVLPRVETKSLQAMKDITQILYQIAISANVVR